MRYLALPALLVLIGCNASNDKPKDGPDGALTKATSTKPPPSKHDHDHDDGEHKHGDNSADAGPYHANLTSHLSDKEGNELDIHFETMTATPKPVAFEHKTLTAKAKRKGDDKEYDLVFEPAPADERPKDEKPGTCSHYVAKAPFMKSTDTLTVTMKIVIRDKERTVVWKDFDVKKFSHHHD